MNADHINPFLSAITSVFQKVLACPLTRGQPYLKNRSQPSHHVSGIIGLTGKAVGTVVLSFDRDVAIKAAEALLHERLEDINADVVDMIGELTNMVAGAAKAQLECYDMNVSLPSVIVGKNHVVQFPSSVTPICVPYTSAWGPVTLEVSLVVKEETENQLETAGAASAN